jgi:hypothetical protein
MNYHEYFAAKDNRKKSLIHDAIEKNGFENFSKEIICECSDEELNEKECFCIKEYNSMVPNGYNIKSGGNNQYYAEEARIKMRNAKLGTKQTEEHRHNISIATIGHIKTEEHRKNLSISLSGKSKGKEHCENISKGKIGTVPWNKGKKTGPQYGRRNVAYYKRKFLNG